jgi:hypothetical protein
MFINLQSHGGATQCALHCLACPRSYVDGTQYVRVNCKIAVVPLVSLPTINSGLPFGHFAAGTKRIPSGPRSPILPIVTPSGSGPLAGLRLSSV